MEVVARFEKISLEQWHKDYGNDSDGISDGYYNDIELPKRSTVGSAGYDFHAPFSAILDPGQDYKFPTGIKCKITDGWLLAAFPRSGMGFKYYARLANTIGIIDSDYYNNEGNEGHIWVKIRNEGHDQIVINKGDKIFQGIFLPYGIVEDDEAEATREGGFGSTGK